jgi:hypothetical protein
MMKQSKSQKKGKCVLMHPGCDAAETVLKLRTRWRWVVSFMIRPLYPLGKRPWYLLDRKLGRSHNPRGCDVYLISLLSLFWKKNKSRLMRSSCCLCVCMYISFECLNQSIWNLLCISWHLSPCQRRTSKIHPINLCVYLFTVYKAWLPLSWMCWIDFHAHSK